MACVVSVVDSFVRSLSDGLFPFSAGCASFDPHEIGEARYHDAWIRGKACHLDGAHIALPVLRGSVLFALVLNVQK